MIGTLWLHTVADIMVPGGLSTPEVACPQRDPGLAEGLNNAITPDEVRQHLPRLHNGRAQCIGYTC